MEPKTSILPNNSRKGVAFKLVLFPYGVNCLTDPNGNRTAVEKDALGIVVKMAVMGKNGEGDTIDSPTAKMKYGFLDFDKDGKLIPSWIKTSSRETHGVAEANTHWLQTIEYSNGTGEVALTKIQAEPDVNGVQRWIGTGRTVLNNKGNPVKQYEPYFSDNDGWESEPEIVEKGVTPIMYYDPLSRLIKTEFPDGTHSKVEFTAWRQDDYDQNDTAEGNPHYDTPTITHLDSLGRPFYVVTNDGENNNIVTRTVLDIEGNEKEIIDARNNTVMKYKYGIHGEKAYTESMDAGKRWMLLAADEQPIYTWDSRGHKLHIEYDELRRPTKQWLNDETLVGETIYGEEASGAEQNNLRGQVWKSYDQSGVVESVKYDFKNNLLESKRQLTQEYKQTINWNANPVLENETFTTITAYDALNRATDILTPHNNNVPASKIMPGYDAGGLLKTVNVNLRGATESTAFVENINYNPKGQRERIKYGNGATTKYTYDEKTFRLTRLWTFRNGGTENLQDLNYTYDPIGNITEIVDNAQQTIFFNGQIVNPSQKFEYDALYRLVKATGREHVDNGANTEPEDGGCSNVHAPMPGDATALRNYTRQWEYDEVGNILKLIHTANNGNWNRTYNYDDNNNRLISTKVGETTVGYNYNEHGSMTEMPHLQNMEWDFAERLSHITRGTTEAYYNYDGSGERIRKVVEKGNIAETRLYLGGVEVFRKKVGNNLELEREMLHIMDDTRRIALVETLTVDNEVAVNNAIPVQRYQLSNNIESATLELDENVNIISYEEYYPYGDTSYQAGRSTSEVSQKRYRYTGKEKDEESGLYYHGARYYAAWLGRWTTVDPAGLVDGLNLYMYCRGDPVKLWDPDGNTGDVAVSNNRPPIDIGSDVYKLGGTLYNEMHRRLTEASEKDGEIGRVGRLLKTLWNTHESRLRVFETDATELLADVRDGVPGVSLNLAIGVMDTRVTNAYQNIFHEFFHNIDMILGLRRNPNNPVPSFADDFGHNNELYHAIKADYYRLSGQGNLPVGSYHKVSERQYRIAQSKLTGDPRTISYTSDIIGIAFSVIRTPDSENFSATNMMGRDMNILGSVSPAAEFFANVAAAAITNPEAFENLRDNFPNAYNVFRRVLESMIHGGR